MASQQLTLADIEKMQEAEKQEFTKAVEDWREDKAAGGGQAVIVEAGGVFAPPLEEGAPPDGGRGGYTKGL